MITDFDIGKNAIIEQKGLSRVGRQFGGENMGRDM